MVLNWKKQTSVTSVEGSTWINLIPGFPVMNDPLYNHTVFGPNKGKGGIIGKSDEKLIQVSRRNQKIVRSQDSWKASREALEFRTDSLFSKWRTGFECRKFMIVFFYPSWV